MISAVFTSHKRPRLTLVGAGPGDPELITVKGVKALESADVVLYDALVTEALLRLVPEGTPTVPVGKRAGKHSRTQEEINEMIVDLAYLYGHVVRLKGGDPFVFGRGGEEVAYALRHGVRTAVVPGISSAVAVPAALNIPLTTRGFSESFWVVTGTTKDGAVSSDVELAARSTATVVILMGLHKIREIMYIFERCGKSDTLVAVIQNGTCPDQRSVIGTVTTIADMVEQEGIGSPAVIVAGEVVRLAHVPEAAALAAQSLR